MLTNDELAEIELRALQATPPPWTAPPYRYSPDSPASYNTVVSEHANICGLHDGGQTRDRIDANAQFIAHAPEDVRALVGELRAERARTETLRTAVDVVVEKLGLCDWSCEKLVFDQCGECPTCQLVIAAIALRALVASVPLEDK